MDGIWIIRQEDTPWVDSATPRFQELSDEGAELIDDHLSSWLSDDRKLVLLLANCWTHGCSSYQGVHLVTSVPQCAFEDVHGKCV